MSEDVSSRDLCCVATLSQTSACCSQGCRTMESDLCSNSAMLQHPADNSPAAACCDSRVRFSPLSEDDSADISVSRKKKRRKKRWASFRHHQTNNPAISSSIQLYYQAVIQFVSKLTKPASSLAIFWWLIACSLCLLPSSGHCLQCYTDIEGLTIVTCDEVQGFKTCFTKYNDSKSIPSVFPFGVLHKYQERAHIVGRGCSTKDKVFYRECETHSYGANLEKMCFCSFELCNSAPAANSPGWLLSCGTTGHSCTAVLLTKLNSLLKHTLPQLTTSGSWWSSWQLNQLLQILLSCLALLPLHTAFSRGVFQVTENRLRQLQPLPEKTADQETNSAEPPSLPNKSHQQGTTLQGLPQPPDRDQTLEQI